MNAAEQSGLAHPRLELYAEREDGFTKEADELGARSNLVSNLRGVSFAIWVIAAIVSFVHESFLPAGAISVLGAVVFVGLVVWHSRIINAEDEKRRWARVNGDAAARVDNRWQSLPEQGQRFVDAAHPYSTDLDVFGKNSLFQKLCVAHTRYGQARLAEFLSKPSLPEKVRARQQAVKALSVELEHRQHLESLSLAVVERPERADKKRRGELKEPPDPEPLLRWAESKPELSTKPLLRIAAPLFPALVILGMVLNVELGLPAFLWLVPFLGNFVVLGLSKKVTDRVFYAVSATEGAFVRYGEMLELIEKLDLDSDLTRSIQRRLLSGEQRPSHRMNEFRKKVGWFDLRHSGLVHPFAALFLLWDVNCVLALEKWQKRCGHAARGWFEALGEFEALSSLAGLAHDETQFCFPTLVENTTVYEAKALGHVLIDSRRRVDNDVSLPSAGSALLITGSNMSGKSTFLRSMGLSVVMAFAGAPVAAKSMRLSPLSVRTSITVSDSLQSGVSHFYAELNKIKAVVDALRGPLPVFFLLDEILHGTNSRERQIGARWVLSELLQKSAIGAVTTHDMGLCQLSDELMAHVSQFHFRESVQNDQMTFDYKLRPGPVLAGNALRLMRLLGLGVPLD